MAGRVMHTEAPHRRWVAPEGASRPARLDVQADGALAVVRRPSLGDFHLQPGGVRRVNQFVEVEQRRHQLDWLAEELIDRLLAVALVRREQQATAGTEDAGKLAECEAKLGAGKMDDRVERDDAAHRRVGKWQPAHVAGDRGIEPTQRQRSHRRTDVDAEDVTVARTDEGADLARPATDLDDGIGGGRGEGRQQLPVAGLGVQFVEELPLVTDGHPVVRGGDPVPGHLVIVARDTAAGGTRSARGYVRGVMGLADDVHQLTAEKGFSGVVRVDVAGRIELERAYGFADRRHGIANTVDTQLAIASGSKPFTALAVVGLIADGTLTMSTTARSVLGFDLPLIDDAVTIEQLLAHRSGIGDYLDEDEDYPISDYVMPVPVHELAATEQFLAVLDGYPQKFPPGERFSYCNGGYVVLALIAERASGVGFHELVEERVCRPAGMNDTAFLRSDELPGRAALGYLEPGHSLRTNVFHLPVRGSGDGGMYTTVADFAAFWTALFGGRIVPERWVAEMVKAHSDPADERRYGLGFWLHRSRDIVMPEGYDAGVSFRSVHDPAAAVTHTVISNTSGGAWPITRKLDELLDRD
jgi:CubicO group peptidase (beta-lactamase class C family)